MKFYFESNKICGKEIHIHVNVCQQIVYISCQLEHMQTQIIKVQVPMDSVELRTQIAEKSGITCKTEV